MDASIDPPAAAFEQHRLAGAFAAAMLLSATLVSLPVHAQAPATAPGPDALEASFAAPPASARPRVWWHWMNGNVTKEGIRKDLEWMQRVGIGGLQNFDANLTTPQICVYVTTPENYLIPGSPLSDKQFKLPRGVPPGGALLLDLGKVGDIAEVRINGQLLGTLWHAPYRIDIGKAARKGSNELEIRVANLWVNRLIGDAQQGATKVAYTASPAYRADAPLRPAGLIGPVQLLTVQPSTITSSRQSAGK